MKTLWHHIKFFSLVFWAAVCAFGGWYIHSIKTPVTDSELRDWYK
jgi:hypothetical protein